MDADKKSRGWTVAELARYVRIGRERLRGMIRRGELGAINTAPARCGRPRYIVFPHHLAEWERLRQAATAPAPARRRRQAAGQVDYYPDA
jgi:hypothetical protein